MKFNKIGKNLFLIVFLGFLIRLGVIYFFNFWTTDEFLFMDETTYDEYGRIIAKAWRSGMPISKTIIDKVATQKYYYIVAFIYYLFGHNPVLIKILNASFGCALTFLVYHIAKRIWEKKVGFISALFVCLYPTLVLWSVVNLKDISLIFFSALTVLSAILLHERFRWHILLILIVSFWILDSFRDIVALFLSTSIIFSFLKIPVLNRKSISLNSLFPEIIFFVLIFMVIYTYRDYFRLDILTDINLARNKMAKGNLVLYPNLDISSPLKALRFLPIGLSYFLLGPFPWNLNTPIQRLILPELILWYGSFGFAIYGLYHSFKNLKLKRRIILIPVLFVLFLSIGYVLFDANLGTMYRHRAQLVPYHIMFFSTGLLHFINRIKKTK